MRPGRCCRVGDDNCAGQHAWQSAFLPWHLHTDFCIAQAAVKVDPALDWPPLVEEYPDWFPVGDPPDNNQAFLNDPGKRLSQGESGRSKQSTFISSPREAATLTACLVASTGPPRSGFVDLITCRILIYASQRCRHLQLLPLRYSRNKKLPIPRNTCPSSRVPYGCRPIASSRRRVAFACRLQAM